MVEALVHSLHGMRPKIGKQKKSRMFPCPKPLGIHCHNHVRRDMAIPLGLTGMNCPALCQNFFKA
jgi:hypothetical protein